MRKQIDLYETNGSSPPEKADQKVQTKDTKLFDNLGHLEWLNVSEAASYLRLTESGIWNLVNKGDLSRYWIGSTRKVRFRIDELKALLRSNKGGQ